MGITGEAREAIQKGSSLGLFGDRRAEAMDFVEIDICTNRETDLDVRPSRLLAIIARRGTI